MDRESLDTPKYCKQLPKIEAQRKVQEQALSQGEIPSSSEIPEEGGLLRRDAAGWLPLREDALFLSTPPSLLLQNRGPPPVQPAGVGSLSNGMASL